MPTSTSHRLRFTVTSPPVVGLPNAPAWMASLIVGEWQPLSTNLLKDVDPEDDSTPGVNPNYPANAPWHGGIGQSSEFNTWAGGALAVPGTWNTYGALIIGGGGGRNNYAGSEIYSLDLGTRVWSRLTNPYPTPDMGSYGGSTSWPYMSSRFPDGSPVPVHSYDQVQYHPGSKTYWILRGGRDNRDSESANASGPNHISNGNGLKLDTLAFRHTPNAYIGGTSYMLSVYGQKSCYDSIRDCFWLIYNGGASGSGGFDLWKIYDLDVQNGDGSYAKWQRYAISKPGEIQSCMRHDPVDDLLIFDSFREATKRIYVYELSKVGVDSNVGFVTQTGTFPPDLRDAAGWDWSPGLNSMIYIQRLAGTDLYRCQKPATAWQTNAWVWSKITAPTNANAVPVAQDESGYVYQNGIYGRLRVVKYANMEVVVVVTRRDLPAYVMRIL